MYKKKKTYDIVYTDSQYKGTNEVAAVFYEIKHDLNNTTILVLKCYIYTMCDIWLSFVTAHISCTADIVSMNLKCTLLSPPVKLYTSGHIIKNVQCNPL